MEPVLGFFNQQITTNFGQLGQNKELYCKDMGQLTKFKVELLKQAS